MKRAVAIYPDGKVLPAAYPDDDLDREIEMLHLAVHGYFRPIIVNPNMTMFVNEEGWSLPDDMKGQNKLATELGGLGTIIGPVIILGGIDAEGNSRGLTVEQANIFLDPKGEGILNELAAT